MTGDIAAWLGLLATGYIAAQLVAEGGGDWGYCDAASFSRFVLCCWVCTDQL
jgi:hypothetical protein